MFFSTDEKGFALTLSTYKMNFISPEFINSMILVIPTLALATSIVLIGYSILSEKAKEKLSNEVSNGEKCQ